MVLFGLAKHCKRSTTLLNQSNNSVEQKSSTVYVPIRIYFEWIINILSRTCTSILPIQSTDAIIFENHAQLKLIHAQLNGGTLMN